MRISSGSQLALIVRQSRLTILRELPDIACSRACSLPVCLPSTCRQTSRCKRPALSTCSDTNASPPPICAAARTTPH